MVIADRAWAIIGLWFTDPEYSPLFKKCSYNAHKGIIKIYYVVKLL